MTLHEEIDNPFWEVVAWLLIICGTLGALALTLGLILAVLSPSSW